jgi:hypothetical protein
VHVNLLALYNLYLIVIFALGTAARYRVYGQVVSLVLALPQRWPKAFAAGTGTPLAVSELAYPAAQCSHSGADCGKLRRVLPVAAASDADTA